MPTAPADRRITAPSAFSTSTASPTRTTGQSARAAITPTKRELRLTGDYPPPDKLANKIGQTCKFAHEIPPSPETRQKHARFLTGRREPARDPGGRGKGPLVRTARRGVARRDDRHHPSRPPHRPPGARCGSPPAGGRGSARRHQAACEGAPGGIWPG